jgi:hypothetical protein
MLLCGLMADALRAEPITASRGTWSGTLDAQSSVGKGAIALRLEGSESRFTVEFTGPSGTLLASEFQTGSRPNVFDPPQPKSFMSFFVRAAPSNPLEGGPRLWARRTGEELIVYRLDVQGGAHRLDRLSLKPAGNRLDVVFERRAHERAPERLQATLERRP